MTERATSVRWLLSRSSWRYGRRHPAQVLLCILGIALGVAVVVSVDIALESSRRSFDRSVDTVRGAATHEIVASGTGVPESLYRTLRLDARIERAAPVIDEHVRLVDIEAAGTPVVRLLGIDLYAESTFRQWRAGTAESEVPLPVGDFVSRPAVIWLEAGTARELGLSVGDRVVIAAGSRLNEVELTAVFEVPGSGSRPHRLALADIATAQELFESYGVLSRIDLVLDADQVDRVESLLPPECRLQAADVRSQTLDQMTRAFQLNLRCLSLLALVVGWFLIFNSMAFSVVQRAGLFSRMRAWGLDSPSLFRWIMSEAALLGSIATVIGLAGGVLLGHFLVQIVTSTLSDLYLRLEVSSVSVSTSSLVKGAALGFGTTALGAWFPAREAARSRPSGLRSRRESHVRQRAPRLAVLGIMVLVVVVAATRIESRSLLLGYVLMLSAVIGFVLLIPTAVLGLSGGLAFLLRPFGFVAVMAPRNVARHLSRTGLAIAALSVAISMSLGVQVMIGSFRQSVVGWLEKTIVADFYVGAPGVVARKGSETPMPRAVIDEILNLSSFRTHTTQRMLTVPTDIGEIRFAIRSAERNEDLGLELIEGDPEKAWEAYESGGIFVSEPFAYRFRMQLDDRLSLESPDGGVEFRVAGIFKDFASDEGYVAIDRKTFLSHWPDPGVTGVALFLADGASVDLAQRQLEAVLDRPGAENLRVASSVGIRESTLVVFDRTFAVTEVLRWLSILVAWVGVFSALLALQLERSREFAVLRARGLLPGQVAGLVLLESSTMGLFAGLLATPLGLLLAWMLTDVINQRSFGWSLEFSVGPWEIVGAVLIALGAGFFSGIWPARRLASREVITQLRGRDE